MPADGQPLVLIIALVSSLRSLCDLRVPDEGPDWHGFVAVLLAGGVVVFWHDREPVRDLRVPIAAERCEQCGVVSVEGLVVARAPGQADHAPFALAWHAHLVC